MKRLMKLLTATTLAVSAALPSIAAAQAYPNRPIKLIVPWPAGGASDIVARAVVEGMRKDLGQTVVVENKAGATGRIGIEAARTAPADGYTLVLAISNTHGLAPALYKSLPYDPVNDFTPVGLVAIGPLAVTVRSSLGVKTLPELVDYARRNPGKLNYASAGSGSGSHLLGEMLRAMAGINIVHVPFKGTAPAINDLAAGHVDLIFEGSAVKPYVSEGRLTVLATTGAKRWSAYPDAPTTAEAGYPKLLSSSWFGIMGPKGMPQPVVDRLSQSVNAALKSPEILNVLRAQGMEVVPSTSPAHLSSFMGSEIERWKANIKLINFTPRDE